MYKQQAYSFIELLISLAVLSGTMLSLMATQVSSYSFLDEARQYAYAKQLAYDLFERVRANPQALQAYAKNNEIPTTLTSSSCDTQACTAEYLADFDMQQWQQRLESGYLADAKACITLTDRRLHLHVVWQDKRTARKESVQCDSTSLPYISRSILL